MSSIGDAHEQVIFVIGVQNPNTMIHTKRCDWGHRWRGVAFRSPTFVCSLLAKFLEILKTSVAVEGTIKRPAIQGERKQKIEEV